MPPKKNKRTPATPIKTRPRGDRPPPARTPPARTVAQLDAGEIARLADILRGGTGNVYQTLRYTFNVPTAGDEVFDRLAKEQGLHRCEECNTWRDKRNMDAVLRGFCTDCVNAINDRMTDDDEEAE